MELVQDFLCQATIETSGRTNGKLWCANCLAENIKKKKETLDPCLVLTLGDLAFNGPGWFC